MMLEDTVNEQYDLEELYTREIQPLLERAHELCNEHKIPFVAASCFKNTNANFSVQRLTCFHGQARTPLSFAGANMVIEHPDLAIPVLQIVQAMGNDQEEEKVFTA